MVFLLTQTFLTICLLANHGNALDNQMQSIRSYTDCQKFSQRPLLLFIPTLCSPPLQPHAQINLTCPVP